MTNDEMVSGKPQSLDNALARELALIKDEEKAIRRLQRAESQLESANDRLSKARKRVRKRKLEVERAEALLNDARERRVTGAGQLMETSGLEQEDQREVPDRD